MTGVSNNILDVTISLVIITKNPCLEWLEKSLSMIDSQIFKDFEIIVVDASNAQVKRTIVELIESKSCIKDRVRVLDQQSVGLWAAFDEAFSYCVGDIVGVINSDDYLADDKVLLDLANVFFDSDVDYVYGNSLRVDSKERALYCHKPPLFQIKHTVDYFVFVVSHHTLYFRKNVLDSIPFMSGETEHCVDLDFVRRLLKSSFKGKYLNRVIACFRLHGENYSIADSYTTTSQLFSKWTGFSARFYFPFKILMILRNPKYFLYLSKRRFERLNPAIVGKIK